MSRSVLLCLLVVVAVCALTEAGLHYKLKKFERGLHKTAEKAAAVTGVVAGGTYGLLKGTGKVVVHKTEEEARHIKNGFVRKSNQVRAAIAKAVAPKQTVDN